MGETCPRCRSRALLVEGYREPSLDGIITRRAVCTSCGFRWDPDVMPDARESA